ncbi:MAG: LemA family protein, partial [Bacteroidetes bacterium]|nr:LemA family protein [Bacteroidota bacterium]
MIIILALLLVLVVFAISVYNRLVRLRNNREQSFADIDV